jgi:hypothetical protein
MLADPRLGSLDYSEGFAAPPADFTDRARVYKTDQQTCTPVECYKSVLVIEEFNPDALGATSSRTTRLMWATFGPAGGEPKRKRKRPWSW